MERTRNEDFYTFNLDLLNSNKIIALCSSSHYGDHLCQVISKTSERFKSYGADMKCRLYLLLYFSGPSGSLIPALLSVWN
jgi:hypothetical protein